MTKLALLPPPPSCREDCPSLASRMYVHDTETEVHRFVDRVVELAGR